MKPTVLTVNGERVHAPCNKCNFCLQNRRQEWSFRLTWELRRATRADFITLTYDNEHIPLKTVGKYTWMTLVKSDLQTFHKSLKRAQDRYLKRKKIPRDKWKIRYYGVGEYGTKGRRPHYHSIIFNIHPEMSNRIETIWEKGTIHRGDVTEASIGYTTKYIIDRPITWRDDPRQPAFNMMSKGLGETYIQSRAAWHHKNLAIYCTHQGIKSKMPRYYKDRIFDEEQRKAAAEKAQAFTAEKEAKILKQLINETGSKEAAIEMRALQIKTKHDSIRIKSQKLNKL